MRRLMCTAVVLGGAAFGLGVHADGIDLPTVVIGPTVSTTYAEAFPVHGIGGDGRVIFALQPTDVPGHDRGIWVSRRGDGAHLGAIVPPPAGWGSALAIKVTEHHEVLLATSGRFLVLDGFTPEQAGTRPGIVYEYAYSYSILGGLQSSLLATHPLPLFTGLDALGLPNGPIYPISLALLPGGGAVVIDMLAGGVWVADASLDDWRLGIIDPRFAVGELVGVIDGIWRAPGGGKRPYEFATVGIPPQFPRFPSCPGIHTAVARIATPPTRSRSSARPPRAGSSASRATCSSMRPRPPSPSPPRSARSCRPPGRASDLSVGLDYDRFNPTTPWLYWQRVVANATEQNRVYRVNLFTGEVEDLANSVTVYNWTNEISVLPGVAPGFTVLTNANMQEENVAESNALLDGVSTLVGPTIVPIASFSNW